MSTPSDPEDDTAVASTPERPWPHRALTGAVQAARTIQQIGSRPSLRPWLLAATGVAFIALVVVSFTSLPEGQSLRLPLIAVLILVATPSTLLLNAVQYRTMAAALGHDIGVRSAMQVSIVATLVNYLPIPAPGGIAVRTAALARRGSSVRSAISINAVTGVLWAGLAALIAGVAMLFQPDLAERGAVTAAAGAVVIGISAVLVRRLGPRWRRIFVEMLVTQAGLVLTSGVRTWLSLAAIGQPTSLGAALAISGSTVIAAMVGIAPAGLGLREAIAGGIAAAVDVPAAAAVAASAVDRVASQIGLLFCAPFTGLRWHQITGRTSDDAAGDDPIQDDVTARIPSSQ